VTYDPAADWQRFHGPVLVMAGAWDVLEPASRSAPWVERLLREAGNHDVTVKLFPQGHHSLLLGARGGPREFATLAGVRQLVPGYWDVLLRWLSQRTGRQ
jgi:pimeloyl-ACP methyl ester carboxylesterase